VVFRAVIRVLAAKRPSDRDGARRGMEFSIGRAEIRTVVQRVLAFYRGFSAGDAGALAGK
jgi:hypothetical protein